MLGSLQRKPPHALYKNELCFRLMLNTLLFNNIFLILIEFHKICFEHIHLLCALLPNFEIIISFLSPTNPVCVAQLVLGVTPALVHGGPNWDHIIKKADSPSPSKC